jgi:transcription initiation factor TFIID TATA-box-binding protein
MVDFKVKVENVVAVAMLGVDVPLDKLVSQTEKAEYEPEHTSGLVYKPGEKGVAALIFSSGKIVCIGTKSVDQAKETVKQVVEKIKKIGVNVPSDFKMEIESIVASSSIPVQPDLKEVASSLENGEYDPGKLPALVYRLPDSKVSIMLFQSGKTICSGARSMDEVQHALHKLKDALHKAGVNA